MIHPRLSHISLSLGVAFTIGTPAGGCGDDGGSSAVPLDQIRVAYAEAVCGQMRACASPGSIEQSIVKAMATVSPDNCVSRLQSLVPVDIEAVVASGRVAYDGVQARACFDALATACGDAAGDIPACDAALTGLVIAGGACGEDIECAGDSFCDHGTLDRRCEGVCTPRRARGESCRSSSECSDAEGPTRCDFSEGVCQPIPTPAVALPGEECGWRESAGGLQEVGCGNGYVCAMDTEAGERRCVPIVAEGGTCDGPGACDGGLVCQDLGEGPKCQPIFVTQVAGGPCNERNEGQQAVICNAFEGLACREDGMCVEASGGEGSPCRSGLLPCSDGYWCGDEGACVLKAPNGGACEYDVACTSGVCGDDDTCGSLVCE